ncbi:MAG: PAS domain S-box protein [Desulfarculaceae bacterium]|nr:PAS domain S-box protein [Desulfarculaceae bacterium]
MARPLVELNRICEELRPILARNLPPNRQGRALIATVGGLLGASGGAVCAWERGGQLSLTATWGLPPAGARRLRTISQAPPACPGEPLGRIGWVVISPKSREAANSGWPLLDKLLADLGQRQHLAVWPLSRPSGSGLALLRFKEAPAWSADFGHAASNLLAGAVEHVLLQAQLSHRQGDYSRIFANSRDMIYLSTRDGRWVDVNPAGVELLGYDSAEDLLSTPDSAQKAYLNPADRQAFQAAIEKDGFVKDYEVSFKKKDGTPIEVAITASVRQRNGSVVGYEGIIKDITASKRAQAQAQAEHSLVASILEVMPVAIFVVDRAHKVIHWNKACEELTGWDRDNILGTDQVWKVFKRPKGVSLADVVVMDDPAQLQANYGKENLRRSPLAPEAWEAEKFFEELGGKPRELFFTAAPLRDNAGNVTGAVEAIVDTTETKELQRKLAESEALYRTLVESNREGIVLHDYKRFVFANQSFLECFGLGRLDQAGSDFLELLADSCRRQYLEWMRSVERGEAAQVFEGQGIRPDGLFDLEVTATPCPYRGASAILFTTRDVTMRKSMEEQLIRSERLAATGKLAFDIAHEVNNPLGGILTYAHLLLEDVKDQGEVSPTVDKIIKLTNRCKIIVRGLLDFARQDTPEKEPMDLNRVLLDMLSLMDGHMILRRVEIKQNWQHGLPVFWGQRAKLEQVFLNMLINAAEAMEGEGVLELSTAHDEEAEEIRVVFSDNGPGMDEEVARRIFEPFFTTKPRGRGTGLGLAISHGIIQQHGGRVEVDTAPGQGCTFSIILPLNDA